MFRLLPVVPKFSVVGTVGGGKNGGGDDLCDTSDITGVTVEHGGILSGVVVVG